MINRVSRSIAAFGWLAAAAAAQAQCSRPVQVPLAAIGRSVHFEGEQAVGVYSRLLREVSASTGCEFVLRRVPRARLTRMFETGSADLLIPAAYSPTRRQAGDFVPLVQTRVSLLALKPDSAPPASLRELLAQPGYKLVVVRGFTFGSAYDRALASLRQQGRLLEEADVAGVARALRLGMAQATVMSAHIFTGTLALDPDLAGLAAQTRATALEELGWVPSGVYLSRAALNPMDRRLLREAFTQAAQAGRVWQLYSEAGVAGEMTDSLKPL
jgi:polar amino acid transport system substrate-binding protein